jgi:hypothetical protein
MKTDHRPKWSTNRPNLMPLTCSDIVVYAAETVGE